MIRSSRNDTHSWTLAQRATWVMFRGNQLAGYRIFKTTDRKIWGRTLGVIGVAIGVLIVRPGLTLPPPEDTPEEVLRNELLFEARSPVDGQPLTAAEYARLQTELETAEQPPPVDPTLQQYVFLLRVLRMVRVLTPL